MAQQGVPEPVSAADRRDDPWSVPSPPFAEIVAWADAVRATPPRRKGVALTAGVVAVTVAAVIGMVVGFDGGTSANAAVLNAVTSALGDRTANVAVTTSVSSAGGDVSAQGTGVIDFTADAMQIELSAQAAGQQVDETAVYLGGQVYLMLPGVDQVEPGKLWVSMDLSALTSGNGNSLSTGNNPAGFLKLLDRGGGSVQATGTSTVGGVPVHGYAVTVSPAAVRARLAHRSLPAWMQQAIDHVDMGPVRYHVDVDAQGQLRRMEVHVTLVTAGHPMTLDEAIVFSDYGLPVHVQAPPPDETVSFQQLLQDAANQAPPTAT